MSKAFKPSIEKHGYDRHVLYEASVQGVDIDIELFERTYKKANNKKRPRTLREDFCGTALLAAAWVAHHPDNEAWGVDLDGPTLDWGRKYRLSTLDEEQLSRVHLVQENVLDAATPKVDIVCALNFSYMILDQREVLKSYFQSVYDHLEPGGLFVCDMFGGPHSQQVMQEDKEIPKGVDVAGHKYPAFTYWWEQATFNAIDQQMTCKIHFKIKGKPKIKSAFTYHWRLYSITEIIDLLREVGFTHVDPYLEGWDEETEDTDGHLKKRKKYEDMDAWIAYLIAHKSPETDA